MGGQELGFDLGGVGEDCVQANPADRCYISSLVSLFYTVSHSSTLLITTKLISTQKKERI